MRRPGFALSLLAFLLLPGCQLSETVTRPGEALFHDDFSAAWSGWESTPAPGSLTHFQDGMLTVSIPEAGASVIAVPGLDFGDVRVEADTLKLEGTDVNRIGLVCRYKDAENFYFFIVSSDGFYGLGKVTDGKAGLLGMGEMQRSDVVQPEGGLNHLRADCIGQQLALYNNGRELARAEDPDHSSGDAGIFAGTSSEAGLEVAFDNFLVIRP